MTRYHRPAAKGRNVWGSMVALHEDAERKEGAMPWRADANENTIIYFDDAVQIEGEDLAAGKYGLPIIPGKEKATVIFSQNTSSWGSFFYQQTEDALGVKVAVKTVPEKEFLAYDVLPVSADEGIISLNWAGKEIPVKVTVNTREIAWASFRDELRSIPGFSWQGWNQAASYCAQNNFNHEEALTWADQSIRNVNQLNNYGYALLNLGKHDKAIEVFKINVEKNSKNANVNDSLGEAYVTRNSKDDK